MKRIINRVLIILVLVLATFACVACGDKKPEKTDLEIALESKMDSPSSYKVTSVIKVSDKEIYRETTDYTKADNGYNYSSSIKKLNALSEENEYSEENKEGSVNTSYSCELKNEYFNEATVNDGLLKANLTDAGAKAIVGEGVSEAKIEVAYSNGKVNSITLTYKMNNQDVSYKVEFTY